jgi:CubicO group peptidase (beta-lactamase class C family)
MNELMTRRRFCAIALAAPVVARGEARKADVALNKSKRIEQVENGLMEIQDGKLTKVNMGLPARMNHYHVPGLSVAVIDDYKIAWTKGYGVLEEGRPEQVAAETLFASGSISKPVSAAAALALVEKGHLKLDEDVNAKLRSWKVPENEFTKNEKVTLRRLLSHSAGLNEGGAPSFATGEEAFTAVQTLDAVPPMNSGSPYRQAEPVRVQAVPGSRFLYSPGGYAIVTVLMEDVEKRPFQAILRDAVFKRLGMTSSTFEQPLPDRLRERATTEHRDGQPLEGKRRYFPGLAAGGLWTTPADLARFTLEIMLCWSGKSHKILSSASVKGMLTCQVGHCGGQGGQALGFWIQGQGSRLIFTHKGGTYGSACQLVAFPATGQGAIVMANDRPGGEKLVPETMLGIGTVYGWPWDLA